MHSRKFTVDNIVDDHTTQKILMRLKFTAKIGDLARKALQEIETNGFYDGQVRIFGNRYNDINYSLVHTIREYREIVRSEWMPLSDIQCYLGDTSRDKHGGSEFKTADVFLEGTMYTQGHKKQYQVKHERRHVGMLRLKKSGLSFDPAGYRSEIVPVYKTFRSVQARNAVGQLAGAVATQIVESTKKETYLTMDLRRNVRDWIFQEGHAQRWMEEMAKQSNIVEVMSL